MDTGSATDQQLFNEVADQGWIGLHLGEQFDGLGLGPVELAVVAEELGRACMPGPWLSTTWAATLLAMVDGPSAKKYVPKIIEGSSQATVAVLENQSSWDITRGQLQTTLCDDRSRLSGRKNLVLQAAHTEWIVCLARHGQEVCLVLVPSHADGVRITETPGIDATRKLYQCDFENVSISSDNCVATGESVRAAWERSQHVMLVAVTAEMLGMMQWMLETTVEYAKTRKQFDQLIGSFQSVQTKCADMLLMTESARSAVWYAAWALQEDHTNAARAVSVAKAYVSDAARTVGNFAVQVHGGIGFTWEHDLQLYYKRAKADEYLFGDATFHREKIAELVFFRFEHAGEVSG